MKEPPKVAIYLGKCDCQQKCSQTHMMDVSTAQISVANRRKASDLKARKQHHSRLNSMIAALFARLQWDKSAFVFTLH